MRKIILSTCLCLLAVIASAQVSNFTATGTYHIYQEITANKDTVLVFVFNGVTSSTQITYTGTGNNFNWYKYSSPTTSITNLPYYSPDASSGYIFNVDGKKTYIWIIDYTQYKKQITIEPENNPTIQCEDVILKINAPEISYQTLNGVNPIIIPREFNINYTTLKWSGTTWVDSIVPPVPVIVSLPTTQISVKTPFRDTYFTLSRDQFAADLGIDSISGKSTNEYITNAVISFPTTIITERFEKNEALRPSQSSTINFSAPFDIQFQSNANVPVAEYYKWQIFKDNSKQPLITYSDKDIRYTFTEKGQYNVVITVSNSICSHSDSISVNVSISDIQAPNVFTPNGDKVNDEFRVAYKSIISFQAWVYNRWGRLVFHWTDPTKGWDGNINGRPASPGAYFYVIKAKGSDYDPNSTPNKTTHLRLGEYILKGDINLLR